MITYPAIDIRGGKAVRLVEGDFARETTFDADPLDAARRWESLGAEWIHIVDLDGARDGVRKNHEVIARIRSAVACRVQLGGGLRDLETLLAAAQSGIDRLVIGSAAIAHPELIPAAVHALGDRIAVGLDARDGMIATNGWQEQTSVPAEDVARRVASEGVQTIVFTDIGRDGRLEGPNIAALASMVQLGVADVIASGGVSSIEDIERIRSTGASGVIIGAALYHQRFTLPEALRAAGDQIEVGP